MTNRIAAFRNFANAHLKVFGGKLIHVISCPVSADLRI